MEKIKVLHTKNRLSSDGATAILLNMATELKGKVQFDFLLYREEGNDWAWKFEELGSNIYYREAQNRNLIIRRFEKIKLYNQFFKEHVYSIVHIDTDTVNRCDILFCAWLHRVKKRIYHSHNSRSEGEGRLAKVPGYKKFLKFIIVRLATDIVACSSEAAKWMFPPRSLSDVKFIKNGIYTDKFRFNQEAREKIRSQYGLENCFVIGCVARFVEQKNHTFLIDIFTEVVKEEKESRLLLIGDGVLKEDIQKKVADIHLNDKVIFVGTTDKVEDYMSAMDIYIMPSLFEGLGMVFIEAQSEGLYCLGSTNVPLETKVSERMQFFPLFEQPLFWKDKLLSDKSRAISSSRENAWEDIVQAGYDIQDTSRQLLKIYQSE